MWRSVGNGPRPGAPTCDTLREIVRKNYPALPPTRAPYYQAVRVGNWLFLSGATARDTEAAHGDMASQTEVIFKRMQHILEAEGASLQNVVKITSFVTDISSAAGLATHRVREKYFGNHLPASTRVQPDGQRLHSRLLRVNA